MRTSPPNYDPRGSLREARDVYFRHYGFNNGGYDDKWVKLKAGPIPIFFPNIPARVIAVKYHDLHHIITGYQANWVGEAEIGAWEIASGCKHHWPAWILNLDAMAIGLLLAPRRTYRAFLRGRRSENLYGFPFNDDLLAQRVGTMRQRLHVDGNASADIGDMGAFVAWSIVSVVVILLPFVVVAAISLLFIEIVR
jgi:hypothetical protein